MQFVTKEINIIIATVATIPYGCQLGKHTVAEFFV
jgi:hypothetical protein